ncbi:hypothetical protein EAG_03115 [Camponotus floridanus]|uniref:Ig-like domain-containing protein n=1 Tax=Camponotus floridanus TaxID=104421 RepID=E2AKQ4_CAMFO|nr:hypothetical protein EAG_03115 [Camponotus floridanus]
MSRSADPADSALCARKNPRVKSHACQPAPFFFYLLQSPTPPQYVFWYHNNRMINYDTTRGSVTVQTDPGPTQSRLTIRQAVESDTGNYTCSASNTKPASIFVFVTEGKYKQCVLYVATGSLNQYGPPRRGCPLVGLLTTSSPNKHR